MPIQLGPRRTSKYVGGHSVPQDVARLRREVRDMLRYTGTPMLHKHRYNDLDFKNDKVEKSEVYDDVYEQTRHHDPLSHGVGYVSLEKSDNEWYNDSGHIVVSNTSPGSGYRQAPRYRGYGPGTLTYIIEPDRAEDFFKSSVGGPIFKVQTALAIAPWYPNIDDNDILINVVVAPDGKVLETNERFEAKNVNPVSIRGYDRFGRKENGESFGNNHIVNQQFEMNLIPTNDTIYEVETDR